MLCSSHNIYTAFMKLPHTNASWKPKLNVPLLLIRPSPPALRRWVPMATGPSLIPNRPCHHGDKVVVIMGATGSGKSQLSIDLATLFPSEIINSDKMQVYSGLDITTNKIPPEDRLGIPHHLIGSIGPEAGEFTPSDFRALGQSVIEDIISRGNLPFVVGGSNSFIYALLAERFNPGSDVLSGSGKVSHELVFDCCFLWVDLSFPVLDEYLRKRVDDMFNSGMFEELVQYYYDDTNRFQRGNRTGLQKAIGVPEFERCFRRYAPRKSDTWAGLDPVRRAAYQEAVREIKENTCQLAKRQIGKIMRLRDGGWDLRRLNATEAFRAAMAAEGSGKGHRWADIWEAQVLGPSAKIVKRFLEE
ncbi:hypothetical protein SAY86_008131 [Trapa natans]|uniref:Adenylate isopentenyltransferase n=1 Tax=Trapa natans TaxID=22666 RepID=A0AAN7QAD9_TRANT|nr:hypothetical protein SAY86_008131 [Trapa natans]